MKIIFGNAYTKEERREFVKIIHKNVLKSIETIVETTEKCHFHFDSWEKIQFLRYIKNIDENEFSLFKPLYAERIQDLWEDAAIKTIYKRHLECNFLDSTE